MQLVTDKIEQLLIKFGKYIASKERNNLIQGDKSEIYDADLSNFKQKEQLTDMYEEHKLQSTAKTN